MLRKFYVGCVLVAFSALANAQAPAPACTAAEHHQFDFWLGDWDVKTPDGKPAGSNHIEAIAKGCALLENWTGAKGGTGKSLNIYDASRKLWHQTWVDSTDTLLKLDGGFRDGKMILENPGNRITWTPRADGTVTQVWETTADEGKTWTVGFDGIYKRVKAKKTP